MLTFDDFKCFLCCFSLGSRRLKKSLLHKRMAAGSSTDSIKQKRTISNGNVKDERSSLTNEANSSGPMTDTFKGIYPLTSTGRFIS